MKSAVFLKIMLIFNIFYCFRIVYICKQIFYVSRACISQKVKGVIM